jgi:hypothetical protein
MSEKRLLDGKPTVKKIKKTITEILTAASYSVLSLQNMRHSTRNIAK